MGIWGYLRHYINLVILKSLLPPGYVPYTNIKTGEFATVGPYTLDWETQQYKCWISQPIVFFLLASLQAINIFWYFLIIRILYRIIRSGEKKDDRSDDEEEEEEGTVQEKQPLSQLPPKENGHATPTLAVNGKPVSS